VTLPMPEFEHLQSCAGCGHSKERHGRDGVCLADAYCNGIYAWCPCTAYQPSEEQ